MIRLRSVVLTCLIVIVAAFIFVLPTAADDGVSFSGTISFVGDSNDHNVSLSAGQNVIAELICTEASPGNRPLDPYLTVYGPNGFSIYNDDDYSIQNCNSASSSLVTFIVPTSGTYTFNAAGCCSSTGPYRLNINSGEEVGSGNAFFEPGDDRLNRQAYAYASVYCDDANHRVAIYGINSDGASSASGKDGDGFPGIFVYYFNLPPTPSAEDGNVLIEQAGNIRFYRLTSGEYQVMVGPDSEGKDYVLVWDGCPHTYIQAYSFQNGVMTPTERFPR